MGDTNDKLIRLMEKMRTIPPNDPFPDIDPVEFMIQELDATAKENEIYLSENEKKTLAFAVLPEQPSTAEREFIDKILSLIEKQFDKDRARYGENKREPQKKSFLGAARWVECTSRPMIVDLTLLVAKGVLRPRYPNLIHPKEKSDKPIMYGCAIVLAFILLMIIWLGEWIFGKLR